MKLLTTIVIATLLTTNAYANTKCDAIGKIAQVVMQARQKGLSASEFTKLVDPKVMPLFEYFIVSAYSKPRFKSENNVKSAITEFENSAYIACLKTVK